MQSVWVTGRFVDGDDRPLRGEVKFIPSKVWVDEGDQSFPCPAPTVMLDEDGEFGVHLIRTDQHGPTWYYTVICPTAKWTIFLDAEGPLQMKNLVPKRFIA